MQNATVNGVVMHAPYDSQWRILISLPAPDADLMASAVRELMWDFDRYYTAGATRFESGAAPFSVNTQRILTAPQTPRDGLPDP